jgi:hypothetical protein
MQIDPHAQYTFHTKDQLLAQLNFIVARSQFNQLTMDPTLHAKDVFDGNKSLYLVFVGVVFLSILDCF